MGAGPIPPLPIFENGVAGKADSHGGLKMGEHLLSDKLLRPINRAERLG